GARGHTPGSRRQSRVDDSRGTRADRRHRRTEHRRADRHVALLGLAAGVERHPRPRKKYRRRAGERSLVGAAGMGRSRVAGPRRRGPDGHLANGSRLRIFGMVRARDLLRRRDPRDRLPGLALEMAAARPAPSGARWLRARVASQPRSRSTMTDTAVAGRPSRQPSREAVSLTKHFGGVTALDDVSLWALAGEVTALVGENGAGKSTLIKCLTGVYQPHSGEIRVGDKVVRFASPLEARLAGIETVY